METDTIRTRIGALGALALAAALALVPTAARAERAATADSASLTAASRYERRAKQVNPEGWQMVAGGRRGKGGGDLRVGAIKSATPAGWQRLVVAPRHA